MYYRNLFLVCGVVAGLCSCRSSVAEQEAAVMVKAGPAREFQDELEVTYPGRIRAAADVDLSFRVAGPLLRMPAEVGQFVRQGETVAEIDPRDYELQLKATEAQYKQIKSEAGRVIELYHRKSVAVNDYDKAVAGLEQITSKYSAHRNALADTRLLAPFDGYIQKKYFDTHETVAAGMPVISMINTGYFEVEIDIPSGDYIRQDRFRRFTCVPDVFPDHRLPLELIDITKKANLNQLYQVRLRLKPVKEIRLAAGMSVNVYAEYTPEEKGLVQLPLTAVFGENGQSAVWIYRPEDQSIHRRAVRIRQVRKDGTVILEQGVQAGEIVVQAGVHRLKEGMRVELLKPVTETNIGGLL